MYTYYNNMLFQRRVGALNVPITHLARTSKANVAAVVMDRLDKLPRASKRPVKTDVSRYMLPSSKAVINIFLIIRSYSTGQ